MFRKRSHPYFFSLADAFPLLLSQQMEGQGFPALQIIPLGEPPSMGLFLSHGECGPALPASLADF